MRAEKFNKNDGVNNFMRRWFRFDKVSGIVLLVLFFGIVSVWAGNVLVSEDGIRASYSSSGGNMGLTQNFICIDGNGENRTLIFENGLLVNVTGEGETGGENSSNETIYSHATLGNGLILYYDLDETSGDALDLVGSNDGAVSGASQGVDGEIGTAYYFDGVNDVMDMGNDLSTSSSGSVSFWIKPSTTANVDIIGINILSENNLWRILKEASQHIQVQFYSPGNDAINSDDTLAIGEWNHVVVTGDGNTWKIYIDGTESGSSAIAGTNSGRWWDDLTATTHVWTLGANYISGDLYYGEGDIDEIGIWERALSSSEVEDLYNDGEGLAYE